MDLQVYVRNLEKKIRELEIHVIQLTEEREKLEERLEALTGFWGGAVMFFVELCLFKLDIAIIYLKKRILAHKLNAYLVGNFQNMLNRHFWWCI
jgi:hypothetical protein